MSAPALTALVVTTDQGHVRVVDGGGQEQLSITAHARPVTCIALSPDGTLLATGSEDRAWKLFDATSGAEQACGRGHDSLGACICAKAADTVVKSDCPVAGHAAELTAMGFSHCGRLLATGSLDRSVLVWDTSTSTTRLRIPGHTEWVVAVGFSPDGARLASRCFDGASCVWHAGSGQLLARLAPSERPAFLPAPARPPTCTSAVLALAASAVAVSHPPEPPPAPRCPGRALALTPRAARRRRGAG